ncbi:hypothetical protein AVEN_207075-1 [Araneus ventricosus]|uniref:Uncharacterized protein n=1 Tax=Araneus ventricosus TaxID=182803 RepID=A0A4Y2GAP0_ARAVE|nr:hypothetical protein AVEN_207075-1 [Araneus ventricosus]
MSEQPLSCIGTVKDKLSRHVLIHMSEHFMIWYEPLWESFPIQSHSCASFSVSLTTHKENIFQLAVCAAIHVDHIQSMSTMRKTHVSTVGFFSTSPPNLCVEY